ncbi:hypothetical protein BKA69DRAFT_609336 [Paraphysoderma sedebokerense]|nr:hypothetical protein BKA69DRAFT_609336 [Paraphysoderma sedebokerense]
MNSSQLLELEPKSLGDSFSKSLAPKAESNNLPSAGTSSPPNGSCENLNSLPVENPLPVPVLLSHFDALPACHSLYSSYKFCFESDWDRAAAASKAVSGGFDGCFLSSTEPAFTNYTPGFRGCLDYIFNVASCIRESDDAENARVVAAQKDCGLKVLKMLQFPEVEEYQKTFLPNEKWSSDHFALMLELEYA